MTNPETRHKGRSAPLKEFNYTANEKERGGSGTLFTKARIEMLRKAGLKEGSMQLVNGVSKAYRTVRRGLAGDYFWYHP